MGRTGVALLIACLLGIPAGVGAFTLVYAKGYSYLSTDPRTCVDCHIMTPQYEAWRKSGHRLTTICGFAGVAGVTVLLLPLLTNIVEDHALLQRAATATRDMLDVIVAAKKAGAGEADLKARRGCTGRRSGASTSRRRRTRWASTRLRS